MPRAKSAAPKKEAAPVNTPPAVAPVAAPVTALTTPPAASNGTGKKRQRASPAAQNFAIWIGSSRSPVAFTGTKDEVQEFIKKTDPAKHGKITVYQRVPLKVNTSIEI